MRYEPRMASWPRSDQLAELLPSQHSLQVFVEGRRHLGKPQGLLLVAIFKLEQRVGTKDFGRTGAFRIFRAISDRKAEESMEDDSCSRCVAHPLQVERKEQSGDCKLGMVAPSLVRILLPQLFYYPPVKLLGMVELSSLYLLIREVVLPCEFLERLGFNVVGFARVGVANSLLASDLFVVLRAPFDPFVALLRAGGRGTGSLRAVQHGIVGGGGHQWS
mmetsp:Transcript_23007/g.64117  ORF Transcript_23007/g.64117 Transcript_23007/m.64117 type:complete len:218 (+) Transcript_23007:143-796(+)